MKAAKDSSEASDNDSLERIKKQKEMVENLKVQWKLLWSERFNDKVRAEGVSLSDYATLNVERGTIIHATRDFKPLNFKEILEGHMIENPDRFIQPNADVGGWNKFVKTKITCRETPKNKCSLECLPKKREVQQPKKNGRGWLHTT